MIFSFWYGISLLVLPASPTREMTLLTDLHRMGQILLAISLPHITRRHSFCSFLYKPTIYIL